MDGYSPKVNWKDMAIPDNYHNSEASFAGAYSKAIGDTTTPSERDEIIQSAQQISADLQNKGITGVGADDAMVLHQVKAMLVSGGYDAGFDSLMDTIVNIVRISVRQVAIPVGMVPTMELVVDEMKKSIKNLERVSKDLTSENKLIRRLLVKTNNTAQKPSTSKLVFEPTEDHQGVHVQEISPTKSVTGDNIATNPTPAQDQPDHQEVPQQPTVKKVEGGMAALIYEQTKGIHVADYTSFEDPDTHWRTLADDLKFNNYKLPSIKEATASGMQDWIDRANIRSQIYHTLTCDEFEKFSKDVKTGILDYYLNSLVLTGADNWEQDWKARCLLDAMTNKTDLIEICESAEKGELDIANLNRVTSDLVKNINNYGDLFGGIMAKEKLSNDGISKIHIAFKIPSGQENKEMEWEVPADDMEFDYVHTT